MFETIFKAICNKKSAAQLHKEQQKIIDAQIGQEVLRNHAAKKAAKWKELKKNYGK